MFDGFFNRKFREVFEKRFPDKDAPFHKYYDMSTGDFTGTRNKNVFSVYFQFSARINSAIKKMYGNWNNKLWYGSSFADKLNRIPVYLFTKLFIIIIHCLPSGTNHIFTPI